MRDYVDMPARMRDLPCSKAGYPVPWFVAWIDGEPDFRVVGPWKVEAAMTGGLCWVCGYGFRPPEDRAFVIGPMCAVNRVSAEPPSHEDCATWSAVNCPFLSNPNMVRREKHLPDGTAHPPGTMIARNPGVACVWVTRYRGYRTEPAHDGWLFRPGDPVRVGWYAEGRPATREEVLASISSGTPILAEACRGEEEAAELARMLDTVLEYVPGGAHA